MPAETVSDNVETLINLALAEDFGSGDVTSTYFVPEHLTTRAILTPRKKGVLSGVNVAAEVFRKVDPTLKVEVYLHDGEAVAPGAVVNHSRLPSAGKSSRAPWRRHQPPHGPL